MSVRSAGKSFSVPKHVEKSELEGCLKRENQILLLGQLDEQKGIYDLLETVTKLRFAEHCSLTVLRHCAPLWERAN